MHYENPRIKLSEWSLAGAERLRKGGEKNDIRTLEGVLVQAYMLVDGNPQRHPEILAKESTKTRISQDSGASVTIHVICDMKRSSRVNRSPCQLRMHTVR